MSYKEKSFLNEDPLNVTFMRIARESKKRKHKLQIGNNRKYNSGHSRIRGMKKGLAIPVVVGSVVVSLMVTMFSHYIKDNKEKTSAFLTNLSSGASEFISMDVSKKVIAYISYYENLINNETFDIVKIRQNMIQKYCAIYSVSYEQVYAKLVELTDHFSNENFVKYLTIDGVKCKSIQPYADNEEELFIYAIRAMAQTPSAFGFDESLYVESTFVSSMDYASMIDHYARVFQVDRRLPYAIIASETSFNSSLFLNSNNPAGIRGENGEFVKYDNLDRGMIEFYTELLKYHFKNGANTIEEIRDIHAPLEDGNANWLPNVTSIYNDLVCGVKNPFSNEAYVLWRHNGEEVYSVFVDGEQDSFFGDRELYQNQMGLK